MSSYLSSICFGAILFFRFVSPSRLFVSTKAIPLGWLLFSKMRSAGKYWSLVTLTKSPVLSSLHCLDFRQFYELSRGVSSTSVPRSPLGSIRSALLLFSRESDFWRLLSSMKSFTILTAIRRARGGKLVGEPPVIEIGLTICITMMII